MTNLNKNNMKTDKITRQMVRDIAPGSTEVFELPSYGAIQTGKVVAYEVGYAEGTPVACSVDRARLTLSITKTNQDETE